MVLLYFIDLNNFSLHGYIIFFLAKVKNKKVPIKNGAHVWANQLFERSSPRPRLFSSLRQKRYKSFPSVFHVSQKNILSKQ